MIGLLNSALVEAAIVERDRRLERAAAALREPDADRTAIIISCQCWSAIVIWLDTDKFESFIGGEAQAAAVGGDGQPTKEQPIIRWPELEAAAERALASAKDDTEANRIQKARLAAIHAKLARMRRDVDWLNAEFKKAREREAA